ncbi:MAG: DUF881 domain-containing protein [Thermotaleaceae bacterium]
MILVKLDIWKLNILALCILLGFLISLQVKSVTGDYLYVPLKVIYEYKLSIESEKKEIENLLSLINERSSFIANYEKLKMEGGLFKDALTQELENQKLVSGFVNVEGPGIVLTVDDGTRELYSGENPNNILVHDGDILNLINDLKIAGAEALSINGQRIISTSEINCAGHTIRINNQVFAQPFIIKAIGEQKTLEAAINAPGQYGQYLKEFIGLYVDVKPVVNVKIPRYQEDINYRYLQVAGEGE